MAVPLQIEKPGDSRSDPREHTRAARFYVQASFSKFPNLPQETPVQAIGIRGSNPPCLQLAGRFVASFKGLFPFRETGLRSLTLRNTQLEELRHSLPTRIRNRYGRTLQRFEHSDSYCGRRGRPGPYCKCQLQEPSPFGAASGF